MKKMLLALLLVPCICMAQKKEKDPYEVKGDGTLELVHADKTVKVPPAKKEEDNKKKLKDNEVYTGNVKFKIGSNEIACDSAVSYTNDGMVLTFHNKISNAVSFAIISDMLTLNKENAVATLSGGIKVTAQNGNVVGTTDELKIDFSYDLYKIVGGSLTPPPNKEEK